MDYVPEIGQRVKIKIKMLDMNECGEVVGHHLGNPIIYLHGSLEYRSFHPEYLEVIKSEEEIEMEMAEKFLRAIADARQDNAYDTAKAIYKAIRDDKVEEVKLLK